MADIIITPGSSLMSFTSSLNYTQTLAQDASGSLTLQGSGSTGRTDLFTVNGNNGTLFSVSDDLSNSLFSVNTIAGLPVIEAFADNTVVMGQYGQNVLVVTGSNVGVGTSSPSQKLHIYGSGNQLLFIENSSTYHLYTGLSSNVGIVGSSNATPLSLQTNGNSRLYIDTSGNIGIGTTNPAHKFHVQGSNLMATFRNSSTSADQITQLEFIAGSRDAYIWLGNQNTTSWAGDGGLNIYTGTGNMDFWTAATQKMRITSAGNVGIGTTNPTQKLHVVGAIRTQGAEVLVNTNQSSIGWVTIEPTSAVESQIALNVVNSAGSSFASIRGNGNAYFAGAVGIGTTSPGRKLVVTGAANDEWIATFTNTGTSPYGVYIDTSANSGTNYSFATYTNAGTGFFIRNNGLVGIGTTSPSLDSGGTGLDILNASYTQLRVRSSANSAGIEFKPASGDRWEVQANNSNQWFVYNRTDSEYRLLIDGSGNVGIGTTSPSSILQLGAGSYTATNSSYNSFNAGSFGVLFRDANDSYIAFNTIYSQSSGWVNKYSSYKSAIINFNDGRLDISTGTGTTAGGASNLSTKLVMTNDGNVGIGTTSPGYKLDVSGVTSTQGLYIPGLYTFGQSQSGIEMQLTSTSYNAIRFYQGSDWTGVIHSFGRSWSGGVSVGMINIEGYNGVSIGGWNAPTAYFLSSGNVGIGTINPSSKLQINASTSDGIILRTTSNAEPFIALQRNNASNGVGVFRLEDGGALYFDNGATGAAQSTKMTITGGGNVGIGTTNPGYKLEINGGASAASYRLANGFTISQGSSNYASINSWIFLPGNHGLYASPNNAHIYPNDATYGAWKIVGSRNGWGGIEFEANNGNVSLMIDPGSNTTGFHNNAYGWQFRWNNGTLYVGKNSYGGGTDATVWDSSNAPRANFDNLMYYQGFTLNADTMATNSTGFTYAVNAPTTGPIARFSTGGSYDMWLNGSYGDGNSFFLRTRNGDTGTLNPWRSIVHSGNIANQSVSYASSAGNADTLDSLNSTDFMRNYGMIDNTDVYVNFRVMRNSNSSALNDGMYIGYDGTGTHHLRFFSGGSTERMRIQASTGNVGIGTTSPAFPLDVNGSTNVKGSITGQDSSGNYRYEFAPELAYTRVGVGGVGTYKINSGAVSTTSMLRIKSNSTSGWLSSQANYFNGTVISDGLCAEAISTVGTLLFLTTDGEWGIADADVAAKSVTLLGIALNSTSGIGETVDVLIDGIIALKSNHDQISIPASPGAPLYVSTNAGKVTEVAPAVSGDIVRLVGHNVWSATSPQNTAIIRFQPDNTWIEL